MKERKKDNHTQRRKRKGEDWNAKFLYIEIRELQVACKNGGDVSMDGVGFY